MAVAGVGWLSNTSCSCAQTLNDITLPITINKCGCTCVCVLKETFEFKPTVFSRWTVHFKFKHPGVTRKETPFFCKIFFFSVICWFWKLGPYYDYWFNLLLFLSPPVHIARWAHMHPFLSVCLSGCTQGTLYTTTTVYGLLVHQEGAICTVCTSTWLHSKHSCQQMSKALLLWQVGLIANVKLHFLSLLCANQGMSGEWVLWLNRAEISTIQLRPAEWGWIINERSLSPIQPQHR